MFMLSFGFLQLPLQKSIMTKKKSSTIFKSSSSSKKSQSKLSRLRHKLALQPRAVSQSSIRVEEVAQDEQQVISQVSHCNFCLYFLLIDTKMLFCFYAI